jgi:hypothetical protein
MEVMIFPSSGRRVALNTGKAGVCVTLAVVVRSGAGTNVDEGASCWVTGTGEVVTTDVGVRLGDRPAPQADVSEIRKKQIVMSFFLVFITHLSVYMLTGNGDSFRKALSA